MESNVLRVTSTISDLIITLSIKSRRDILSNWLLLIHFARKFEERLANFALEDTADPYSSMSHSTFLEEGFLALRYCPQTRQSPICITQFSFSVVFRILVNHAFLEFILNYFTDLWFCVLNRRVNELISIHKKVAKFPPFFF